MPIVCPMCSSPVDGAYCSTCGTPAPAGVAPAASRAVQRKPQKREVKAAAAVAPRARSSGRTWVLMGTAALAIFVTGMAAGYGLSIATGAVPRAAESATGEPPLALASRYLDEGAQSLGAGSRTAAVTAFRKSLRNWETALQEDPDNLYARTYLGLTQFYLGNRTEANAALQEVLTRDPDYLWALFNLAWVTEVSGNKDDASRYYQRYLDASVKEKGNPLKYAEQPELIDRQIEAARQALTKLKGGSTP